MQQMITQGVVLKAIDFSESDKIITILTPLHGRITAILKGVKKVTAKMKFASQPFCFAQFKLVGRGEIPTVAGATEIENFFDITQDYNTMIAGSAILEMADAASVIDEPSNLLFSGLVHALKTLATMDADPNVVLMRFALGVFKISGYGMNLRTCKTCGKPLNSDIVRFDVDTGEFVCVHCCKNRYIPVSSRTVEVLYNMSRLEFPELDNIVITSTEVAEFHKIIQANFALRFGRQLNSIK